MKDTDKEKVLEFYNHKGVGLMPSNEKSLELIQQGAEGEVYYMMNLTPRDLSFHRCYFSLLNYIWSYLPDSFKTKVPCNNFYKFLKHLKGQYKVLFEFQDGSKMIEYESIAFGRMSEHTFKEYVKEQLPYIYENVIGAFYKGEKYDNIVKNTENEYEIFMSKL